LDVSDDTAGAPTVGRIRGFVMLIDTLCDGVVPAEWDADGHVILYASREDAESEREDWSDLRRDTRHPDDMSLDDDDDTWIEAAVLHGNGSLTLLDSQRTLTLDDLQAASA
jgi:hypothetical protein